MGFNFAIIFARARSKGTYTLLTSDRSARRAVGRAGRACPVGGTADRAVSTICVRAVLAN
jgi:hypothetical protein